MKKRSAGRTILGVILLIVFVGAVGYLGFFANTQTETTPLPAQTPEPGGTQPVIQISSAPEDTVSETIKTGSETTEAPRPETSGTPQPEASESPETSKPGDSPSIAATRAAALGLPEPPDIDINSWELMLVNIDNSIDQYAPPEIVNIEGQYFDSRIVDAMNAFVADARAQGLSVYLSSGYRSYSDQAANFQRVVNNGYVDGKTWDGFYVSMPAGTSEHQTGLVCDITDIYYPLKDRLIENTDTYKYMSAHCQEFGFIVRYPDGKQDITGVMYEPWHFRYVGTEAAKYIMENGLCLEEFLELYK